VIERLKRGRVRATSIGAVSGVTGAGALYVAFMDPGQATWPWALGMLGSAISGLAFAVSSWMGQRESAAGTLGDRVETLEGAMDKLTGSREWRKPK
jgi:hypothetical protein